MKKTAAMAVCGLIILMQGGCTVKTETECERVLAYMSERYGDSFSCPVYYDYDGTSIHQYFLNAEKLGDAEVKVEVLGYGTPRERYLDNYMGVKYDAQLKEKIEDVVAYGCDAEKEDMVVMLHSRELGISDHWTPETGFKEYCMDPAAGIAFSAVVRGSRDPEDPAVRGTTAHRLEDRLSMEQICCTGWIYFVREDTDLEGMNEITFFDRVLKHLDFKVRLYFNMKTANGVDEFVWDASGNGEDGPELFRLDPAVTAADGND